MPPSQETCINIAWGWGCNALNLLPLPPYLPSGWGGVGQPGGGRGNLRAILENGGEFLSVITCHIHLGDKLGGWNLESVVIHFSAFG